MISVILIDFPPQHHISFRVMNINGEIEEFQLSELEKRAQERCERLKNIRADRTLGTNGVDSGGGGGLMGYDPRMFE